MLAAARGLLTPCAKETLKIINQTYLVNANFCLSAKIHTIPPGVKDANALSVLLS